MSSINGPDSEAAVDFRHAYQYAVGCLSVDGHSRQRQPSASYDTMRVRKVSMGVCGPLRIQFLEPRALRCITQVGCVGS